MRVTVSSFAAKKQVVTIRLQHGFKRIICYGAGTPRHAQLLALILIPFVFVTAMTASTVTKEIVESLVPNQGSMAPLIFLVGITLFILSLIICFIWVRTGGFGIFV